MSPMSHALHLPEILFLVVLYLDRKDITSCSQVSKSLCALLTPYVWENVHLGLPSSRTIRSQDSHGRFISFNSYSTKGSPGQPFEEDMVLPALQRNAQWIHSLWIHGHHSTRQWMFSEHCTRLESLSIQGLPFNEHFDRKYWDSCKTFVRQNSARLQSLTLEEWDKLHEGLLLGQPLWSPIVYCSRHTSLRSLTVRMGKIRGRHMPAFWQICKRLESLELEQVFFDIQRLQGRSRYMTGIDTREDSPSTEGTLPTTPDVRLPRLRNLILTRLEHVRPLSQLNLLIRDCPMLQTLVWDIQKSMSFPGTDFCNHFTARAWPDLDSIVIKGHKNLVNDRDHATILQEAKRPFKLLDLKLGHLGSSTFNLLRNHLTTLTKVDLRQARDIDVDPSTSPAVWASKWVQEVLESCPSLEHIIAVIISANDIVKGNPWICLRLKVFQVMINMEFITKGPDRGRIRRKFTEMEESTCRSVFGRLSQLRHLKALDMQYSYWSLGPRIVPLPLEVRVGLGQLSVLKDIEMIHCHFSQDVHMVDVEWMLQHWPQLRKVNGGRLSSKISKSFRNAFVRDYLMMRVLNSRGVQTVRRWNNDDHNIQSLLKNEMVTSVYDSDSESEEEN